MSRVNLRGRRYLHGFPRVSGDEPIEAIADQAYTLFSPRERG